jgi:hypothetical protein
MDSRTGSTGQSFATELESKHKRRSWIVFHDLWSMITW